MALSIVNVAVPGQPFYVPLYGQLGAKGVVGTTPLVFTTVTWAPFLWLVTCVVIIVSYARKPARPHDSHNGPTSGERPGHRCQHHLMLTQSG